MREADPTLADVLGVPINTPRVSRSKNLAAAPPTSLALQQILDAVWRDGSDKDATPSATTPPKKQVKPKVKKPKDATAAANAADAANAAAEVSGTAMSAALMFGSCTGRTDRPQRREGRASDAHGCRR